MADTDEQAEQMTTVYLGNHNATAVVDGERVPDPGKHCTTVKVPGERSLMEAVHDITGPNGLWRNLSTDPAPVWCAAQGPLAEPLTQLLAAHYGCEIREPDPEG